MPIAKRQVAIRNIKHTRVPVTDPNGIVLGVLPILSALLDPQEATKSMLIEPIHVASEMPVGDALQLLRKSGVTMAIITNANDRPVGIVTLKDLVEPLVGELNAW